MDQKNIKSFVAAEYLTYGELDKTALGDVVCSLVSGDVKRVESLTYSVQVINGAISSVLDLVAQATEGHRLDKEETAQLADVLYLMSSLSRLCSNAAIAADGARSCFEEAAR